MMHCPKGSSSIQDIIREDPHLGFGLRRESGCMAADEFGNGNRCTADQLLERVSHAVVTAIAMQLAHGDQVGDQMVRQPSIPQLGLPDQWGYVNVLDGAPQDATELLRVLSIVSNWTPVRS